ncbi:MAG: peptidylprolyl isomerase [Candidatus Hydrogenedentota bacterium]
MTRFVVVGLRRALRMLYNTSDASGITEVLPVRNATRVMIVVVGVALMGAWNSPARAAVASRGKIVHAMKDTSRLDARFAGTLKPGVEYHAVIELARGGKVDILFYPETAPNHVANFVSLARKGYYDSVTFHRVLPGFMAQGGDPSGTGAGGPGYAINAEFSNVPHLRGTVSMARTNDPNSAGSQFFICFQPTPFLDGKYTVFGQVVKGMDRVDSLTPRDPARNPGFTGDAIRTVKIVEVAGKKPASRPARTRRRGTKSSSKPLGSVREEQFSFSQDVLPLAAPQQLAFALSGCAQPGYQPNSGYQVQLYQKNPGRFVVNGVSVSPAQAVLPGTAIMHPAKPASGYTPNSGHILLPACGATAATGAAS